MTRSLGTSSTDVLVFRAGQTPCALDIRVVHELRRSGELTPVYGAPSWVRGVVNHRGRIVTIVDLAEKLAAAVDETTAGRFTVIVQYRDELIGLWADELDDIVASTPENRHAPPSKGTGVAGTFLSGLMEKDERLVCILDVDRLLR